MKDVALSLLELLAGRSLARLLTETMMDSAPKIVPREADWSQALELW